MGKESGGVRGDSSFFLNVLGQGSRMLTKFMDFLWKSLERVGMHSISTHHAFYSAVVHIL